MSDYKPSSIVVSLCKKLNVEPGHGSVTPIAEVIRSDGTVVIVVADGRKLTFTKDDITCTLTETGQSGVMPPLPASASRDAEDTLDDETNMENKPRKRSRKGNYVE